MLPARGLFSILLLSCSLLQIRSASPPVSTKKNGFYILVVEIICYNVETQSTSIPCKSCLTPLITRETLWNKETQKSKIKELKNCMDHIPDDFNELRCQLETNSSYYMRNIVGKACLDELQVSSPFIDLDNADLGKLKSNPGYYGPSEFIGLTLAGMIKHSKLYNSGQLPIGSGTRDFCTLFQGSGFLSALSQANGKSWEIDFGKRTHLFFAFVNRFVCKEHTKCYQCLQTCLRVWMISEHEISPKEFNDCLKCKESLPTDFENFRKSLKKPTFTGKIAKSCIDHLKLKEKSFRFDADVYITDLGKNTYFLQEVLKMGIATVFYYFNRNKDPVPDAMTSGLCETVVHRYVRFFSYAMPSLNKDGKTDQDLIIHPYESLIQRICGESDICKACYKKITTLIDLKRPKEVSKDGMQVLKHCSGHLPEEFKSFVGDFEETSFETCMKSEDSYKALTKDYPMDPEVDIKSSPSLPNFQNFKKYLEFLFKGVCYYYKDESETDPTLAKEMHKIDLPGAFMFAIPATNEFDTRGCQKEAR